MNEKLDAPKSSKESSPLLELDDDGDDSQDRDEHSGCSYLLSAVSSSRVNDCEEVMDVPIPWTARPKMSTGMLSAKAQIKLPSSKKKMAASRMYFDLMMVRSWPTRRMSPHWVTVR